MRNGPGCCGASRSVFVGGGNGQPGAFAVRSGIRFLLSSREGESRQVQTAHNLSKSVIQSQAADVPRSLLSSGRLAAGHRNGDQTQLREAAVLAAAGGADARGSNRRALPLRRPRGHEAVAAAGSATASEQQSTSAAEPAADLAACS